MISDNWGECAVFQITEQFSSYLLISIPLSEDRETPVYLLASGDVLSPLFVVPLPSTPSPSPFGRFLLARNSRVCSLQMLAGWLVDLCSLDRPLAADWQPRNRTPSHSFPKAPLLLASTVTTPVSPLWDALYCLLSKGANLEVSV